ncbi:Nonribosomal peptide synthase agiA (NRPS agiA) (Aspergillicins biosynthesis cluster protein A) [Includes: Nonribosomal peptide synthetase [Durusdinium trenchii]|uniref:Nonribosomal peptide synthase agiA (NRPS agiA) (Aspergillicins biosynthesis cluster protein A) n=1 Tax=Durusdinium trenchii TaxID=1381693 RepID=A0ABP0IUS9_9DINO
MAAPGAVARFFRHARRRPHDVAFQLGPLARQSPSLPRDQEEVTYGELEGLVRRFVAAVRHEVAASGTAAQREQEHDPESAVGVVGVGVPDGQELLVCQLGTLAAGLVFLPVDLTDPRHKHVLEDAQPRVLVVRDEREKQIVGTDKTKVVLFAELMKKAQREADLPETDADEPTLEGPSHLFFTSGSTGTPKGILGHHQGLNAYVNGRAARSRVSSSSKVLLASAFTFDPHLGDTLVALAVGARLCGIPRHHVMNGGIATALQSMDITHVCLTPTVWKLRGMAQGRVGPVPDDRTVPEDFPELEELALGGEPMPQTLIDCALGSWNAKPRLVNIYGVTECTVYQSTHQVVSSACGGLLGQPLQGTSLGLLLDDGSECWVPNSPRTNGGAASAAGPCEHVLLQRARGEVLLQGPQVALSYWNRGELSKQRFRADATSGARTFRSGDIGELCFLPSSISPGMPACSCGETVGPLVRLVGRMDHQVKIRGVRVELGEIETVVREHQRLVAEAAVVMGSTLVAFVVPQPEAYGVEPSPEVTKLLQTVVQALCRKRLPAVMVPARVDIVGTALPTTSSGKVDRAALVERAASTASLGHAGDSSTTLEGPLENLVGDLWSKRFGVPRSSIGPLDAFADLGGDSLEAQWVCHDLVSTLSKDPALGEEWWLEHLNADKTFGMIPGAFAATHLLASTSLRKYCKHLAANGNLPESLLATDAPGTMAHHTTPSASTATDDRLLRGLFSAAAHGLAPVVDALVNQLGCEVDAGVNRDDRGKTPLHAACVQGHARAAKVLLQAGANVFATTQHKSQVAHVACTSSSNQAVQTVRAVVVAMRQRGVANPVKVRDGRRQTLLHAAARGGNPGTMEFLLEQLAKDARSEAERQQTIGMLDHWTRTALHWAVVNGNVACATLLLRAGAVVKPPVRIRRKRSTHLPYESPLDIARRLGNSEMQALLTHPPPPRQTEKSSE